MTNAELISRINANIKTNGREQINGEELNFILRQILGLISNADASWGSISGDIEDQGDLIDLLSAEIPDVSGLQSKPVVVSSNITAQNDTVYHVVANATFTDPSPVEGRGYVVFVRNGTATIGGVGYTLGRFIWRIFHSGGWNNFEWIDAVRNSNLFVPQTRTINGKALTINVTLTPSDIGAPSGSGTSTGTNTGDETQSSILSKLGWFKIIDTTDSATLTGVSTETIMKAVQLPTLTDGSKFKINDLRVTKAGVATCTIRAYINNVDDNLSGAVQILTSSAAIPAGSQIATMERTFKISSGNIKGISAATGVFTDKLQSTATPLNAALPTGTLYLIVTLTQAVGESSQVELIDISNF
jgi:hypothetical protein